MIKKKLKETKQIKRVKKPKMLKRSVTSNQATVTKVKPPRRQIILTQIEVPIDKKKYNRDAKEFAESLSVLSDKIDKLMDTFVKKCRFKVQGHDRVKGMLRHYLAVYMCYEVPDEEFKSIFVSKDQNESLDRPMPTATDSV